MMHLMHRRMASLVVGQQVQAQRTAAGWSQSNLAERLGAALGRSIDQSTIARLEGGKRPITVDELVVLAELFDLTPVDLLVDPDVIENEVKRWSNTVLRNISELQEAEAHVAELKRESVMQKDIHMAWLLLNESRGDSPAERASLIEALTIFQAHHWGEVEGGGYFQTAGTWTLIKALELTGIDPALISDASVASGVSFLEESESRSATTSFIDALLKGLTGHDAEA